MKFGLLCYLLVHSWKWKSKTSITHIPKCNLPVSCWQKCRKRYSSHDTKVVNLPPHHPHRAMRRFHVQHKSVCTPTDWADWASRPFCLLEVHLVPRLSSYWNSGATRAARRLHNRADKGWAMKRARPSKKVWCSGLGLCLEMSLV